MPFVDDTGKYNAGVSTISATNIPRIAAPVVRAITIRTLSNWISRFFADLNSNLCLPRVLQQMPLSPTFYLVGCLLPPTLAISGISLKPWRRKHVISGKMMAQLVRECIILDANPACVSM
ncbi:hypothetical protein [Ruegeria arenilitoris]|uniref:hypothetical protein n=1 Tax=Ruegeria arenilitoris TaxID=1173585 RepID=UPI001C2B7902|nr:hypothetical protein [Ruegeria arenilitoris]